MGRSMFIILFSPHVAAGLSCGGELDLLNEELKTPTRLSRYLLF